MSSSPSSPSLTSTHLNFSSSRNRKLTLSNDKQLQRSILHLQPSSNGALSRRVVYKVGDNVEALQLQGASPTDWRRAVVTAMPTKDTDQYCVRFTDSVSTVSGPSLPVTFMRPVTHQMLLRCIQIAEHVNKPGFYFPWVWTDPSVASFLESEVAFPSRPLSEEVAPTDLQKAARSLPFFEEGAPKFMKYQGVEYTFNPKSTLQSLEPNALLTEDALDFALLLCVRVASVKEFTLGKLTLQFTTRLRQNVLAVTNRELSLYKEQVRDDVRAVVAPFCVEESHYTFALLFPQRRTVLYFDPYGPTSAYQGASAMLMDSAIEGYSRVRQAAGMSFPLPTDTWTKLKSTVPYQHSSDHVNCGVFCAMVIHCIAARNPGALLQMSSVSGENTHIDEKVKSYRKMIADCIRSRMPAIQTPAIQTDTHVNLLDHLEEE